MTRPARLLAFSVMLSMCWATSAWGFGISQVLRHEYVGFDGLEEVSAVTASDDGRFLYAAGLSGIVVAEVDPNTGLLTPRQSLDAEIEYGVFSIRSLALSPDGRHLYGVGSLSRGVVVFARDLDSGLLTLVQSFDNGDTEANLRGVQDIVVGPQGRFVHTASTTGSEISTFARDDTTGQLTLVDRDNSSSSPSLRFPTGLDIPREGQHLYAVASGSIVILDRNTETGELDVISTLAPADLPPLSRVADLVFDPRGTVAYAVGTAPTGGAVLRLTRDLDSGDLTPQDSLVDTEDAWGIDEQSRMVLGIETVGVVESLHITGGLSGQSASSLTSLRDSGASIAFEQTLTQGVDGVTGLDGPWEPVMAGNTLLFVPAERDETVTIWRRGDFSTLTAIDAVEDGRGVLLDGLDNPYFAVAPPDGKDVYVLGWANESLVQYRRGDDGTLSLGQAVDLRSLAGPEPRDIRFLEAAHDGQFLVAHNETGRLLFFARQGDGSPAFLAMHQLDLSVSDIVWTPDLQHVLMSDGEDDLEVYAFDGATGGLTLKHQVERFGDSFESLIIDPSGRHLYAGGGVGNSAEILRFDLDPVTAEPVFAEESGIASDIGLRFWDLAFTSDGRHLMATSSGTSTLNTGEPGLVVLQRDQTTGQLTEIQRLQDDVNGLDFFGDPLLELSVSPNDQFVAVNTRGTLNILERDPASGQLTVFEQKVVGDPGEPRDLSGRGSLVFSPDAQQIYMPSSVFDSLVVWDADASACVASDTTLCLGANDRFRVEVSWRDFADVTGVGSKVTESLDSGLFWFFDAANWEMLVKVVDGCDFNGHFWVFSAATTNVEYTLTVTDTETGVEAVYFNPLGRSAAAVTDTEALQTCP